MKQRAALLVVDVQLDFCPGRALAAPKGDLVVPVLNKYLQLFSKRGWPVFASRDWHPAESEHFQKNGGIWPAHCVQGTLGANFHPQLRLPHGSVVVSKGAAPRDNGYSAMQGVTENGTTFAALMHDLELDRLYVGGLATDYCVKESVLEALRNGFRVTLLADAVRGVEINPGDSERAVTEMVGAGAKIATMESIGTLLEAETS